ncbi:histidine kinase [Kribbella solani]|uniref:sensor histidine kinase n=1 Tax=Kribbella solani TaxID=236067 RepID=UPI0029B9A814|nr:histidine kinase [Kribbella solani]MDX3001926.1 histidine kinase [Kribbella solani]
MAKPRLLDAGLAVLIALIGVVTLRGHQASTGGQLAAVAYAVIVTLPLVWRRYAPLPVTWLIGLLGAAGQLSPITPLLDGPFLLSFAVAVGTVGALDLRLRSIGWTTLAALPAFAIAAATTRAGSDLIGTAGWLVLAFTIGRALAFRRTALTARADAERTAREQAIERRVTEERLAIARDLHDVITQSVEAVSMQAMVGLQLFDSRPDEARAALQRIRTAGSGASREIRELLGVLRSEETGPMPGLDDLPELVKSSGVDGPPASYQVTGEPRPYGTLAAVTLYRVTQEALNNTRRHARARSVQVELTWTAESIELTITDDGTGPNADEFSDGGHGLRGMRERLALVDGRLELGPGPGGGFRVHATVPSGVEGL